MTNYLSHGKTISLEPFRPAGAGPFPAVVIAYGTRGMTDPFGKGIRDFATALAAHGIYVAIPNYLERTKTAPSSNAAGDAAVIEAFLAHRDEWIETLGDGVAHVSKLPDVQGGHVGLLGFSMGGHLALRLAKAKGTPSLRAVVEFFAPITQLPFQGLGSGLDQLSHLQIHHGEADRIVSVNQSHQLESLLIAAGQVKGRDFESHYYAGEDHGFKTAGAIRESTKASIEFFQKHLA